MNGPVHSNQPDNKKKSGGKDKKKPVRNPKEYAPRSALGEEMMQRLGLEPDAGPNALGDRIQSARPWNPRNFFGDAQIVNGYLVRKSKSPEDKIQAKGDKSMAYLMDRFQLSEEDLRPKSMGDGTEEGEDDED